MNATISTSAFGKFHHLKKDITRKRNCLNASSLRISPSTINEFAPPNTKTLPFEINRQFIVGHPIVPYTVFNSPVRQWRTS
jgi:hypothetical protein